MASQVEASRTALRIMAASVAAIGCILALRDTATEALYNEYASSQTLAFRLAEIFLQDGWGLAISVVSLAYGGYRLALARTT